MGNGVRAGGREERRTRTMGNLGMERKRCMVGRVGKKVEGWERIGYKKMRGKKWGGREEATRKQKFQKL